MEYTVGAPPTRGCRCPSSVWILLGTGHGLSDLACGFVNKQLSLGRGGHARLSVVPDEQTNDKGFIMMDGDVHICGTQQYSGFAA